VAPCELVRAGARPVYPIRDGPLRLINLVAIRAKQTQKRRVGRPLARSAGALIAFAEAAEQPPEKQRHDGGGGISKFNPI